MYRRAYTTNQANTGKKSQVVCFASPVQELSSAWQSSESGYIAVATVLVVSAVVVLLGIATSLLSVSGMQTALAYSKSARALALVESCAEVALLDLQRENALPSSVVLTEGGCSLNTTSQIGTVWVFTVSGSFDGYVKTVEISADRGGEIEITSWREL